MKEKTFEDLIQEVEYNLDNGNFVVSNTVKELMQQVREATIAECLEIAEKGYYWASTCKKIECLPTDRIKTTEQ